MFDVTAIDAVYLLSICSLLEKKNETVVGEDVLELAFKLTAVNLSYGDVVNVMSKEPNTRGKSRKLYKTTYGQELDLYGLILESLANNPPIMKLNFESVYERIIIWSLMRKTSLRSSR